MPRKAIIIDLDGTLCRRNTFNIFLSELLRAQIYHPIRFITLAGLMGARKLRIISHAGMKRRILGYFRTRIGASTIASTVRIVEANANPSVTSLLESCRKEGYASILASAAPEIYTSKVADKFGFDYCIATPDPQPGKPWHETRSTQKLTEVKRIAATADLTIDIAVSDHKDDMPLLEAARKAILVQMPVGNLVEIS